MKNLLTVAGFWIMIGCHLLELFWSSCDQWNPYLSDYSVTVEQKAKQARI
jgi:hypothetical protein